MPSEQLGILQNKLQDICESFRVIFVLDFNQSQRPLQKTKEDHGEGKNLIIEGKFGSPGRARNAGLKVAEAQYICFWDVDDEPSPSEFCHLLDLLTNSKADIAIGSWRTKSNSGVVRGVSPFEVGLNPGIWRMIFRRQSIGEIEFAHSKWGEDQQFIAELFSQNLKIVSLERVVYEYNDASTNSLTSDIRNVGDLQKVYLNCMGFLHNAKDANSVLLILMLLRQNITMARFGDFHLKITTLRNIFGELFPLIFSRAHICSFMKFSRKWLE